MNVPMRYTTSAPSRKNRRWRSSAKRVISPKAESDAAVAGFVATGSFVRVVLLSTWSLSGRFDLAAGSLDRRLRAFRHVHAFDSHSLREFTRGDDARAQRLLRNDVRGLERSQVDEVAGHFCK